MEDNTKRIVLTTIALLGFGGAGFVAYRNFAGAGALPATLEGKGVCIACKQEVTAKHSALEPEPLKCPACGEKSVFKWWYCSDCHRRFVPKPELGEGGIVMLPMRPRCSGCSCESVTYFIEDFVDQSPIGDVELPRWPVTPGQK